MRDVDGNTIYVVSDPKMPAGPSLEFGVVNDQVVVGTGGGIEDLVTEPSASLADDPQYQAVMDFLPSEYYQVVLRRLWRFYADDGRHADRDGWRRWRNRRLAEAGVATPGPAAGSPANIRALAAVSYQRGEAAGSSAILYIAEPQS